MTLVAGEWVPCRPEAGSAGGTEVHSELQPQLAALQAQFVEIAFVESK